MIVSPRTRGEKYTPAIASDGSRTIGLKSDGTITLSGWNPGAKFSQSEWQDVKQITAANSAFVGVRGNGTVVLSSNLDKTAGTFTQDWNKISAVCFDGDDVIGLTEDGKVLLQNTYMYTNAGGKYGMADCRKLWHHISSMAARDGLTIGITNNGTVEACRDGKTDKRFMHWKNIKAVAIGSIDNVVGLKDDGTLETSQCRCPVPKGTGWGNLKAVAAGPDFLLGLRKNGTVVVSGRSWDVSSWSNIAAIAAGKDYAVGLTQDGDHVLAGQHDKGQDLSGWKGGLPAPSPLSPFYLDLPKDKFPPIGLYPYYANGPQRPIEWRVLLLDKPNADEARALVISLNAIDCRAFHDGSESVDWENSDIRQWLNGEFMQTFPAEEQDAITTPPKGATVQDKIFLLSRDEVQQYFSNESKNDRKARPTEYAESQGTEVYGPDEHCRWLLRSPGTQPGTITVVGQKGDLCNAPVKGAKYAIRPAMWIDLNANVSTWLHKGAFSTEEYIYSGYYLLDKQQEIAHDRGKRIYISGDNKGITYEGNFANGQYHGWGIMTWPDRSSYDGDWWLGQRTGKGKYRSADDIVDEGYFKEGVLINGTRTQPNGVVILYTDGQPVTRPNWIRRKK